MNDRTLSHHDLASAVKAILSGELPPERFHGELVPRRVVSGHKAAGGLESELYLNPEDALSLSTESATVGFPPPRTPETVVPRAMDEALLQLERISTYTWTGEPGSLWNYRLAARMAAAIREELRQLLAEWQALEVGAQ